MSGLEEQLSPGWTSEPLPIEIELAEVMFDLDPNWQDWVPPVEVAS